MLEQARAFVPGRARAGRDHVVAEPGGDRDRDQAAEAEAGDRVLVVLADRIEPRGAEIHEIDLVDREHDVADAEQAGDEGVPPRLGEHAVARIDQHHGKLGVGGAGRHVARVLLVPGRVGDDEAAPLGGEEAIGDVDRDALLALRLQPIDQQREIHVVAGGAVLAAVARERQQLVLEHQLGVVEQAADQGGFAVIDAAAGEEAQEARRLLRALRLGGAAGRRSRPAREGSVHQKYPSRFFFSIDAASSRSISRPPRSEVRTANISATISASVVAATLDRRR